MSFWIIAVALTVLALAWIALPLLRLARSGGGQAASHSRAALNVALYRDQLDEWVQQRDAGLVSEAEWRERQAELENRLLEEVGDAGAPESGEGRAPALLLVGLALGLPALALGLYAQLGSWDEWQLTRRYQAVSENLAKGVPDNDRLMALLGDINALAGRDDKPDWLFLQAQAYMQLGAYPAAADAYARLGARDPGNADLIGRQVQALYLAGGRRLDPQVQKLMQEALALNPHQPTVLGIQGMHAFEQNDFPGAIAAWGQALAGMPPASPSARMLEQGISQARAAMGEGDAVAEGAGGARARTAPGPATAAAGFKQGIKVRVELDGAARVEPGAIVYVLAQAPAGGMPFAVVRLPVEKLPAEVMLDDSTAMAPGNTLSNQSRVKVTARVSMSGNAIAQAGDWQGRSDVLTPDTAPPVLDIRIDQQI